MIFVRSLTIIAPTWKQSFKDKLLAARSHVIQSGLKNIHKLLAASIFCCKTWPTCPWCILVGKVWRSLKRLVMPAADATAAQAHKCHLGDAWSTPCGKTQAPLFGMAATLHPLGKLRKWQFRQPHADSLPLFLTPSLTRSASGQSVSANSVWFNFDSLWSLQALTKRCPVPHPDVDCDVSCDLY